MAEARERESKAYLWLEQAAFQQHERLPPELAHQLAEAHAKVLIPILLQLAPLLLVSQALLKPSQDLHISKVPPNYK